ncbi:hypothetical protein A3B35_01315 [Candidatus Kaiserbacteria bacterium RIFCSPLOWO2_01_FULL_54_24]|uniref:Methyltransferase type 11 domain-containing protein n=1 Tax=Candidatus Kaiserbacteria bacterium RIFCSPLOWO2_01_FULL_54_24 TaxID=1798515 RepID=A0A1F6EVH6_9BACT|nr:MAG: hypothetical protein A3B35_01315 [Candidatus Kaiserbacteria bacterium RIFCSPLOWO2_01_FULL_54_24]
MSEMDIPTYGRGIEEEDNLPLFYRDMVHKLHNCGVTLPPDAKYLEVGSGNGKFLEHLRQQGLNVVGVDRWPRGPGIKQADTMALPQQDGSVDCVITKHIFDGWHYNQNLHDQEIMLSEIVRVLKKSGVYYAIENFFEPIKGLQLLRDPRRSQISSLYQKI